MKIHLQNIETKEINILNLPGVSNISKWIFDGGFDLYKDYYIIEYVEDKNLEFNNLDAKRIINNEGIAYAVNSYCDSYSFKDSKTRELWRNAKKSLNDLENYINEESEKIIFEGEED